MTRPQPAPTEKVEYHQHPWHLASQCVVCTPDLADLSRYPDTPEYPDGVIAEEYEGG